MRKQVETKWIVLYIAMAIPALLTLVFGLIQVHIASIGYISSMWTIYLGTFDLFGLLIMMTVLALFPKDAIWALFMLIFVFLHTNILLWAVFGWGSGLLFFVGWSICLGLTVHEHAHTVHEGTVHVMMLFGKMYRTLTPGFSLRIPGEQVLAILPTDEQLLLVTRDHMLVGRKTCQIHIQFCYHISPELAHHAAKERNWQKKVEEVLHQLVLETDSRETMWQEQIELRAKIYTAPWGIEIRWMRIATTEKMLDELWDIMPSIYQDMELDEALENLIRDIDEKDLSENDLKRVQAILHMVMELDPQLDYSLILGEIDKRLIKKVS